MRRGPVSHDSVLRDAAILVRKGLASTFVAMLDDLGRRELVTSLHPLPECGETALVRANKTTERVACSKVVGHDPPHTGRGVTWGHHEDPRGRPT